MDNKRQSEIDDMKNLNPKMICEECKQPIQVGQDYTFLGDGEIVEHTICLEMRGALE